MVKNSLIGCNSIKDTRLPLLAIEVEMALNPESGLWLRYELSGDLMPLLIPASQPPGAKDGLWQHTCFELFIAGESDAGYHEFNFSPSGQWAAYAFSDYRVRKLWEVNQEPTISLTRTSGCLALEAVIAADLLPANAGKPFQVGLSAVIETDDGNLSYWALHHPLAQPDFHHRAGFACTLPAVDDRDSVSSARRPA